MESRKSWDWVDSGPIAEVVSLDRGLQVGSNSGM